MHASQAASSSSDSRGTTRHRQSLLDNPVDKQLLDDAISRIYSTHAFEYVHYDLMGTQEPYDLRIRCRKGPLNRIGLGIRGDSEELVTVLLNVGYGVYKLSGQKVDASLRIGNNPSGALLYSYDAPGIPTLNARLSFRRNDLTGAYIDKRAYSLSNWCHSQEFFLSNIEWSSIDFRMGIRNDLMRFRRYAAEDIVAQPYLPVSWLGQQFFEEAEELRQTNERAYIHEYLGQAIGTGGDVFPNVSDMDMDVEVDNGGNPCPMWQTFDHIYNGIDWGWKKIA